VMHTDVPDSDTGFIKRTSTDPLVYDVDNNNYYTEAEADALNTAIVDGYTSQLQTMAVNLVIGLAGKSATGHDHGDIYYTETEIDALHTTINSVYTTQITSVASDLANHNHTLTDITDSGTAASLDVPSTGNAAAGEVVKGNDLRLIDSRAPTTHGHFVFEVSGLGDSATKDVGSSSGKVAAGDHVHSSYITGNQTITLGGDVSGSGTTSIDCSVDDDSHNHGVGTITGVINTSAGASSAGKLIKLDAAGHVDATMINDADITVGTNQVTGLGGAAEKDVGTGSGDVAQGNHTHAQYSTFDIDDASALTTDVWSASKIISYLSSFYAVLANGFSNHKYSAAIQWERTLAISETGWAQGSGSGAWQANQTYASLAQTSTTGSGTGALFNVGVDVSGVPTFFWVSGGGGYAVDDTLTFTDPGSTSQTCVVNVTTVFTPTGIGFSGTTGSMVCTINHGLGTEYITMSVRGNDDVIEDLGHTSIVTVIDANNVKLEYLGTDYPSASDIAAGEDKFITIIG
jgi:hypothetical protein